MRDLAAVGAQRQRAEWTSEHGARRRDRHAGRKETAEWAKREADAQQRFATHVAPEIARLDQDTTRHRQTLAHAATLVGRHEAATPIVLNDVLTHRRQASRLAARISAERDHLDGAPAALEARRVRIGNERVQTTQQAPACETPTRQPPEIEV